MVLLGQGAQVKAWFGLFGDSANLASFRLETVLVLEEDMCTVYA